MKMSGPGEYRTPNTPPLIYGKIEPRTITETEYRAVLLDMLGAIGDFDPLFTLSITELENEITRLGLKMPIVRVIRNEPGNPHEPKSE